MPDATDNRVLSQLMLLQGTLDSMPNDESMSRFVVRGLKSVPGVKSLNVCIRGTVAEKNDLCTSCNSHWGKTEDNFDYRCKLEDYGNTTCIPIRTVDRLYGFVVFSLNDPPDAFTAYEPYLQNIVTVIALSIDNRQQKQVLDVFNKQLQEEVEHRKQTEEALRESEELFRSYLEYAPDGVYMNDLEGTLLYGNRKCEEIIGYRREELIGKNFLELNILPQQSLNKAVQLLQANMEGKSTGPDEIDLISKEGRLIPIEINTNVVQRMGQSIVLSFVRDITERRLAEDKIQQMAYHDSLTGLPNRKLFSDRLAIALAQAQRNQRGVAVAMLDLDNFKNVNDTLGHDVGDLLLKAAAERLSAELRKGDTVARFGGDEFVLILPDLKGMEDAIQVAQKIVESFRKPFLIDTHQLIVTTSIGIAVYPHDGTDEGILLKNADIAMYQVKQTGRNRYQLYKKA
jgi:diguanylate cyclase (GGDEF)-like protein/PAS domain S-box-containing protein